MVRVSQRMIVPALWKQLRPAVGRQCICAWSVDWIETTVLVVCNYCSLQHQHWSPITVNHGASGLAGRRLSHSRFQAQWVLASAHLWVQFFNRCVIHWSSLESRTCCQPFMVDACSNQCRSRILFWKVKLGACSVPRERHKNIAQISDLDV